MKVKLRLFRHLKGHLGLVKSIRYLNRKLRALSRLTHKAQFYAEWLIDHPEYFEHQMDLNYMWHHTRSAHAIERGVFSSFSLGNDLLIAGNTLDLCCGDGFYSYYFYSARSESVVAIDYDSEAIRFAKQNYSAAKNINFVVGDIRSDIPDGPFNNIVWDASIDYFTIEEISSILNRIKAVLDPNGILSGFSVIQPNYGQKEFHRHELELQKKSDLLNLLAPHFKNIHVFTTTYPDRKNLYFYASDASLPFERENSLMVKG